MNSASVSSFFSRDAFPRTQACSKRKRLTHTKLSLSTTSVQDTLYMIEEGHETRAFTPISPSLSKDSSISPGSSQLKLKRRHANLADIRLAVTALLGDSDFTQQDPGLRSSPRPAPRPSVSPGPRLSPDPPSSKSPISSLRLPHLPISTPSLNHYRTGSVSPTPSMSSCSSTTSPETQSPPLPRTPSSSDDEFSYYHDSSTSFHPAIIKPLVITKHRPATSHDSRSCTSTSTSKVSPKCPLPPPPMPEDDSDSESDSEWYSRELSKILTLRSPDLPNPSSKVRPDSACISENPVLSSKPPMPTTPARGIPSAQLDSSFSCRRSRISIPNYPPPPVPTSLKRVSVTPFPARTPKPGLNLPTVTPPRRPPPRSSIPADCLLVDDNYAFSDDTSVLSFSLYDHSPLPSARPGSPKSAYSQQSYQSPRPSPFPPSFPSTPSSVILSTAEEEFNFPVEDIQFNMKFDRPVISFPDIPTSPVEADFVSYTKLCQEPHSQTFIVSDAPTLRETSTGDIPGELRSRWSSSTLGSVQEEHSRRSTIGLALRAYFSSPSAKSKTHGSFPDRRPGPRSDIPTMPTTPTSIREHRNRESDVMIIGYGHGAQHSHGHRRRGSYVSDVGSEEDLSSTSRRKPIPMEMFLRF